MKSVAMNPATNAVSKTSRVKKRQSRASGKSAAFNELKSLGISARASLSSKGAKCSGGRSQPPAWKGGVYKGWRSAFEKLSSFNALRGRLLSLLSTRRVLIHQ